MPCYNAYDVSAAVERINIC